MDENLKTENSETIEEKPDISHISNSMFDQNIVYEEPKPIGREYFDAVHHGQLKPNTDQIVLTRSMYNKSVIKIEENTKKEIEDTVKYIPLYALIVVLLFVLTVAINTACRNIGIEPLLRLSGGVSAAAIMVLPTLIYVFAFTVIKRIRNAKKAREKALQRLEDRKKECMILGTYDALK